MRNWADLLTSYHALCGRHASIEDQWAWLALILDKDEYDTVWCGWHAQHPPGYTPLEEALLLLCDEIPF